MATFDDDGVPTETSVKQQDVEMDCLRLLFSPPFKGNADGVGTRQLQATTPPTATDRAATAAPPNLRLAVVFVRDKHVAYLKKGLQSLSGGFKSLDASRPWLCYWILHSLALVRGLPDARRLHDCADFLAHCQNVSGGFGGGPQQLSHLAPTYAAVMALATIGSPEALAIPNRGRIYRWLLSLKAPNNGFFMHHNGEIDVRGTYTALATAAMLNILTPELAHGCSEFIQSCQSFEGGYGAFPAAEAHGGYTFCGFAAMMLLGEHARGHYDVDATLQWVLDRQMRLEGGYQGRINKLVDGCYSFWQGAVPALAHLELHRMEHAARAARSTDSKQATDSRGPSTAAVCESFAARRLPCRSVALQRYLLKCCQVQNGGLRDKPGMFRDYYHTCYCLSGLSVVQHFLSGQTQNPQPPSDVTSRGCLDSPAGPVMAHAATQGVDAGATVQPIADVAKTNPWFNVREDKCNAALAYYARLPNSHKALLDLA